MKLDKEGVDCESCDASKYRTRMKKMAPPPPPPPAPVVSKQPTPLSNGTLNGGGRPLTSTPLGEDCAFDESLEGRMELEVVLPDLKAVRMTLERRTPMMDLLVEATTSNKISPGGHIINVISKDERNVAYKPNTPIGSLDATTVYIIPKSALELPIKRMPKLANQPFEQTFRLQVNLPLNQRMVLRVSPRITLAELKIQICSEKEFDHSNHHLVHPAQPDTVLDLNATLEVYGCAEISLMSNSGLRDSIRNTSTNIFPCPKIEEEKKKRGILRLFSRKKRDFSIETTNGSNGLHTSHSEHSTLNRNSYQPKQSIKRKPAPAPPPAQNSSPPLITQSSNSINSRPESEISVKTNDEIESSISHSRHSSDSSGYHEPSVFSDCSENKSPEASIVHSDSVSMNDALTRQSSPLHKEYPDGSQPLKRTSMTAKDTNLRNVPSCSNVSIISASRKRKAPQPPVSTLPAIESPSSPSPPSAALADGSSTVQDTVGNHQKEHGSPEIVQHGTILVPEDDSTMSKDSVQQESEALKYLEDVLQESENCGGSFSGQRILDDSDTDSLKDGEAISICQAEVHANANDQDSSDSIVEPQTVVTPDPALPKSSPAPLSDPNSQPNEVVDASAEDSGISQSLTSDADSSMPSLNFDLKTMLDSGCQEEIYCNIPDTLDTKSVPCSDKFHVQENVANGSENNVVNHSDVILDNLTSGDVKCVDTNLAIESMNLERDFPEKFVSISEKLNETSLEIVSLQGHGESSSCKEESKCDNNSDIISITSSLSMDSARSSLAHTPQIQKKLDNFALGCYAKDDIDIYSIPSPESSVPSDISNQNVLKKEVEAPPRKYRNQPDIKIIPFHERNLIENGMSSGNKGTVMEKCVQLSNMSTLPLTGRSSSLLNLTPQKKYQKAMTEFKDSAESENGGMKRTHSDQNVAKDLETVQMKETFFLEQKRLQEEYRRLQEQFMSWQKQLLCNQSLLQSKRIAPQMPFPSLEGLTSLDNTITMVAYEHPVKQRDTSFNYNDFQTRSLPRPKTKSLSLKESSRSQTPPLTQSPSETSIVNINISAQEPAKRPESLISYSVETQASSNQDDKVTQIPSPQDKITQVPSPQEKVTSGTQAPSPENVLNKDTSAQTSEILDASPTDASSNSLSSPESEGSKSQTLPRPRPKPSSALQKPSGTMTLNRNSRLRSQLVSVTIGSWQQRQMPVLDMEPLSSVASTRSKFMSLENIPQSSIKPIPSTMEKRKLPPVPTDSESSDRVEQKSAAKSIEKCHTARPVEPKSIARSVEPKAISSTIPKMENAYTERGDKKPFRSHSITEPKVPNTVPKKVEEVSQKTKTEIKLASREPAAFKLAKPFVKLSSMKDEPHPPSIIGLKKWPLTEISESHGTSDGRQTTLEDLKASSKKPGGYVQDKVRRAEVDLRKPKSSKTEPSATTSKTKNIETSKLHITKVCVNNSKSGVDVNVPVQKSSNSASNMPPVNAVSSASRKSSSVPKSQSLNSELLSVFLKKASNDSSEEKAKNEVGVKTKNTAETVTVNESMQSGPPPPPPPPPPPIPTASSSAMPTIPPAEQIPVSSQLLIARETKTLPVTRKESKKSPSKFSRTADPREELMLEIRGFGGKQALHKVPGQKAGWHLRVYGTASTGNT